MNGLHGRYDCSGAAWKRITVSTAHCIADTGSRAADKLLTRLSGLCGAGAGMRVVRYFSTRANKLCNMLCCVFGGGGAARGVGCGARGRCSRVWGGVGSV